MAPTWRKLGERGGSGRPLLVTAEVFRHLLIDPVAPPELLRRLAGGRVRDQFGRFMAGLSGRLSEYGRL
jgi:hypothetical protein